MFGERRREKARRSEKGELGGEDDGNAKRPRYKSDKREKSPKYSLATGAEVSGRRAGPMSQ